MGMNLEKKNKYKEILNEASLLTWTQIQRDIEWN